jgi:hypothetical protein
MMKPAIVIGATVLVGGYLTIRRYTPISLDRIPHQLYDFKKPVKTPVFIIERCVSSNYERLPIFLGIYTTPAGPKQGIRVGPIGSPIWGLRRSYMEGEALVMEFDSDIRLVFNGPNIRISEPSGTSIGPWNPMKPISLAGVSTEIDRISELR